MHEATEPARVAGDRGLLLVRVEDGLRVALLRSQALAAAGLPSTGLMVGFIGVVAVANLLIGSMSAKYAFFAPVFVPMFMQVGSARS